MTEELVKFTWYDFDKAVDIMVTMLNQYPKFNGVYGVPRGGLVLAVVLSHRLRIPLRDAIANNTLVVDDISDTGRTLVPYKDSFIATIHYAKGSKVLPNVYVHLKTDRRWIIYPWETQASSKGGLHD